MEYMSPKQSFILAFVAIIGAVVVLVTIISAGQHVSDRNNDKDRIRYQQCIDHNGSWNGASGSCVVPGAPLPKH